MKRVAIIGTQGVPAHYGGFESLAENLLAYASKEVEYTVFCSSRDLAREPGDTYRGARLRYVALRANGAQSILYDGLSLFRALRGYDALLVLGVSGGLFFPLVRCFLSRKTRLIVNIDGLEHRRQKWSRMARFVLRVSERLAVRFSDVVVADNPAIADYVRETYPLSRWGTRLVTIAYGGDHVRREVASDRSLQILDKYGVKQNSYAFALCRVEPENNCHLILEAFEKAGKMPLLFVGNWDHSPWARTLKKRYENRPGIRLAGAVYDLDELAVLRSNAALYVHAHSAGGTNPSLVEAMFFGRPVLAFDVNYNRKTTFGKARYFRTAEQLAGMLALPYPESDAAALEKLAFEHYCWKDIVAGYERLYEPSLGEPSSTAHALTAASGPAENGRTKMLVSAYACEPGLGSEVGVGWHWVLELSRRFEVWVLTRRSNRPAIEKWVAETGGNPHLHFLWYDLPRWARWWKKGRRGIHLYYTLWQRFSDSIIRKTLREEGIDIFHHLTYGNMLWEVSRSGRRAKTFIWGPVGGMETVPSSYSRFYSLRSRLFEGLRRLTVALAPLSPAFHRRCREASLILCKTEISREKIPAKYRGKAVLFTDVAVENEAAFTPEAGWQPAEPAQKDFVDFLSVGRLEGWRGFDLVLEAFAKARFEASLRRALMEEDLPPMRLTLMGGGPDAGKLRRLARSLGLSKDYVTFTGKVPMEVYRRFVSGCDVLVNASLREGAVTVSFDSLALGKPLICLDTTGYTRYFSDEYSILIPRLDAERERSREEVIADLTKAMLALAVDEKRRKEMGEKARRAGEHFSWSRHGEEICDIVSKCVPL